METVTALGGILAAFGLSTSAGLNAYIPLLAVALTARFTNLLNLHEPYDTLTNGWVIGALVVLLIIEMTVDKIPAVDTINDVIQTFVRPVAGAVLFAASANVITDINPVLPLVAGLIMAGGVHAGKGLVRPAVTASTAGTGNWAVSIVEDVIAVALSFLSVVLPILLIFAFVGMIILFVVFYWRRRKRKETYVYRSAK